MSDRSFRSLRRRCTRCGRRRYCEPYGPDVWLCGGCGVPADARRRAGRRQGADRRQLQIPTADDQRSGLDRRQLRDRRLPRRTP
jgi:hypothetical protein